MNDDNVGNAIAKNNHELFSCFSLFSMREKNPYNKIKIDMV
jgi:hypothetical protein